MNDKEYEKLLNLIDTEIVPPEGLKEKLLSQVMSENNPESVLSSFERFIFVSPLRSACMISVLISGILWAVMGKGLAQLVSGVIG